MVGLFEASEAKGWRLEQQMGQGLAQLLVEAHRALEVLHRLREEDHKGTGARHRGLEVAHTGTGAPHKGSAEGRMVMAVHHKAVHRTVRHRRSRSCRRTGHTAGMGDSPVRGAGNAAVHMAWAHEALEASLAWGNRALEGDMLLALALVVAFQRKE